MDTINELLYLVVKTDYTDITKLILEKGVDLKIFDSNGFSPIQYIIIYGNESQIRFLINYCLDKKLHDELKLFIKNDNIKKKYGEDRMKIALSSGDYIIMKMLLNSGIDPNMILNSENDTLLIDAALTTNNMWMEDLLRFKNINLDAVDIDNKTALYLACTINQFDNVKILINVGANPNIQCKDGSTALMRAIQKSYVDIVNLLLSYDNIQVNLQNELGETALMYAVERKSLTIIKKLMEYGTDPDIKNESGKTAYDYANGSQEIIELLSIKKTVLVPTDSDGTEYPFLVEEPVIKKIAVAKAICLGKHDSTKILILKGTPIDFRTWNDQNKTWSVMGYSFFIEDFEIEITETKMQYHIHPFNKNIYVQFNKITLSDDKIKSMNDLYQGIK
jgi:ankyrin repeat protein